MTYTPPEDHEPTFRLASMAPPKRRRTGLIAALAGGGALVVALAAGGIGYALAGSDKSASSAASSSAASTPSSAPAATPPTAAAKTSTAYDACFQFGGYSRGIADDNYSQADLTALKVVADQAGASDSRTVGLSGRLLSKTIDLAVASKGRSSEGEVLADVKQYARDLRKACAVAGFPT